MIPDSTVSTTATESMPIPRLDNPLKNKDVDKNDKQMGGGTTARASNKDAKVALSKRSGTAKEK